MANFVRIIPNSVWEDLEEKGLLKNAFPHDAPSKKQMLLNKFPQTLHHSVEEVLDKLTWNDKFEIVKNSKPILGTDIVELITSYILKSKKFNKLKGRAQFLKILNKKDAGGRKIRKTKVSQAKDRIPRSVRVHKKQQVRRLKKSIANSKGAQDVYAAQNPSSSFSTSPNSLFPY